MGKKFKIIFSIIVFILLVYFLLHVLSLIFIPKWLTTDDNMHSYISKGFYAEKKNSLDILFMGNSDMYRGISPIVLYEKYGIAGYGYTSAGQRMWTAYYLLKDALRTQQPKVIVLGVDALFNETDSSDSNYRKVFDQMQNSTVKLEAINDDIYDFNLNKKISFWFPIFRYHSRYTSLTKNDFKYAFSDYYFDYKGLDLNKSVVPYRGGFKYMQDKDEVISIPEKCQKYLDLIVELCKKNKITLILTELPSADSWSLAKHEAVLEYANSHDLEFWDLNLEPDKFGFDWFTDSSDGGDHLNVYGAAKVTKYLGEKLKEYSLPDHRDDKKYSHFEKSLKKYHQVIYGG